MAEGKNNSFELQQIIGLAAQQVQLLRGIKDSSSVAGATKVVYGNTSANPFAGATQGASYNPFSTGASQSQKGFFGMPSFAQLGTGIAAQLVESKLGSTDISVLSTGSPRSSLFSSFGFFNNKSKVNQEARMMASANLTDKLSTGLLSGAGTALNMFFGSNPYTMAAAFALNIGSDQMKQQNAYNKYLLQNSYKFINFGESTNGSGMAGFGLNDRMNMATYLRHFGNSKRIADTDTMDIFTGLAEGGLLRNASDIDNVKQRMSEYTDIVKKMAAATGETYKSMVGLMADLKKMGIDPNKADEYTSTMKALQNMTGIDYRTISNNIGNVASSITQNSAISADNVIDSMSDKFLLSNALYDSVSKKAEEGDSASKRTLSLISNLGGPEQAFAQVAGIEQELLSSNQAGMEWLGLNFFDYDDATGTWKFNQNSYNSIMSGGTNYNELISKATAKANTLDNVQKNSWLQNGAEYMMSNMDSAQSSTYIKSILNSLQQNAGYGSRNMTTEEQLSLLMGMNSASAKLYGAQLDFANSEEGKAVIGQGRAAVASERIIDNLNANSTGVGYTIKTSWNMMKDSIGDTFAPMNSWLGARSEDLGNWWNGYNFDKISFGSSKEWDYLKTDSFESALDNLSRKFDSLADSSDRLATKYSEMSPVLTNLSTSIRNAGNKKWSSYGIGYMTGEGNTTSIVNTLYANAGAGNFAKDMSETDKQNTLKSYSEYLGIDNTSNIESFSDIGYAGVKKWRNLVKEIDTSAWQNKTKEEKMQDIGFLYAFQKTNDDYLSNTEWFQLQGIVDEGGNINSKYIKGQDGQNINLFAYANGNTTTAGSLTGSDIAKNIKKYKKEVDSAEKKREGKIRSNTWTDSDEDAYQDQKNNYNDAKNLYDALKATSQDTYALFGSVLSENQMKSIGLDWDKIRKGKYSDDDLNNIYSAGVNKIAGLTASQLGAEGNGRMSSGLVQFFSSAGISLDDLRDNASNAEYLTNAVKQGLDNVWNGMVAATPEQEHTKAVDENTKAIKDNTAAILATKKGKGDWKGTYNSLADKYNTDEDSPDYIS